VEKALGTIGEDNSYPCLFDVTAKMTLVWECDNRSVASETEEIIIPFYSAPGKPQIKYSASFSAVFKETCRLIGKSPKVSKKTKGLRKHDLCRNAKRTAFIKGKIAAEWSKT